MKIEKCSNNHYFDKDTFATCPNCTPAGVAANTFLGEDVTVGVNDFGGEGKTVGLDRFADSMKTIGMNGSFQGGFSGGTDAFDPDEGITVGINTFTDEGKTVGFVPAYPVTPGANKKIEPVVGWLVCIDGPEKGRDYRIYTGRNFVGRSTDMDICVAEDNRMSRDRHFSIVFDPRSHGFYLMPGESEGVNVNGESLMGKYKLSNDDIIECGSSKFCFIGFSREGRDWN